MRGDVHDRRDDRGQTPSLDRWRRRPLPDGALAQLGQVREQRDQHAIRYWVDADAISLDGKSAIAVINFGRAGDATRIQTILDDAG